MLNPRDGLEERDGIFSFFSLSNNVILLDITNTFYNYIKLINTTRILMISTGGVKFSWPVACENLTEGSLSHGSQFLTEHLLLVVRNALTSMGAEGFPGPPLSSGILSRK